MRKVNLNLKELCFGLPWLPDLLDFKTDNMLVNFHFSSKAKNLPMKGDKQLLTKKNLAMDQKINKRNI